MKLRNKKTGEILGSLGSFIIQNPNHINCEAITKYDSLAELNEEWEDYEEPKEYWYIDADGELLCEPSDDRCEFDNNCKQIGNYFKTEEEAEKAVERLRAWKRLKDKGIEFYGWRKNHTGTYDFLARWKGVPPKMQEIINELDLLFGGEE